MPVGSWNCLGWVKSLFWRAALYAPVLRVVLGKLIEPTAYFAPTITISTVIPSAFVSK